MPDMTGQSRKSFEWRVVNLRTGELLPRIYRGQKNAERTVRALSGMIPSSPDDNLKTKAVQVEISYRT